MKKLILLFTCLTTATLYGQPSNNNDKAVQLLREISTKLNGIENVSYDFTRESRYFSDNYHSLLKASIYIDYSTGRMRFRAINDETESVFNGQTLMRLDKNMTIDTTAVRTERGLEGNSHLFHSFAMLKNTLPMIIANDSIIKKTYDTTLNNELFYCIEMEGPQMYFGGFNGINHFTKAGLRRPYFLIVDRNSLLPFRFAAKIIHDNDDRDFITVSYSNVKINPGKLPDQTWNYSSYAARYKPYQKPVPKPLVTPGTMVKNFQLLSYTPTKTEPVSFSKYANKVVLLDFWFKSCGYCMQAMPHYKELQAKMGTDFQLITVNIEDGVDDMQFFYNKYKPNYPMLYNGKALFESFGLIGCPSSLLIDRSGKIVKLFEGFSRDSIETAIKALL